MDVDHLASLGLLQVPSLAAHFTFPAIAAGPVAVTVAATLPSAPVEAAFDDDVAAVQQRMQLKAESMALRSARFLAVEPCYYEQPLEWRRDRLGAGSVEELCKSVVMENTKFCGEAGRVRCILVIVQYVEKLNKEKLMAVVRGLEEERGLPPLGKKQYNMRLLEGEACAELTGFGHNAVTPLGLELPMVLSHKIAALPAFWLGGGHVDLKLNISVEEAKAVLGAMVADVTA